MGETKQRVSNDVHVTLGLSRSLVSLLMQSYVWHYDRLFLLGLKKFGKGDWRSISRNVVITRTPTQVASHAQKYFLRQNSGKKERKRSSIHDITTVDNNSAPIPFDPNWISPVPNPTIQSSMQQQLSPTGHLQDQGGALQTYRFPM